MTNLEETVEASKQKVEHTFTADLAFKAWEHLANTGGADKTRNGDRGVMAAGFFQCHHRLCRN